MQQSNTSRIQPTEQALLFCFSPRFFLVLIFFFAIANTFSGLTLPQLNCFTNEVLVRISYLIDQNCLVMTCE